MWRSGGGGGAAGGSGQLLAGALIAVHARAPCAAAAPSPSLSLAPSPIPPKKACLCLCIITCVFLCVCSPFWIAPIPPTPAVPLSTCARVFCLALGLPSDICPRLFSCVYSRPRAIPPSPPSPFRMKGGPAGDPRCKKKPPLLLREGGACAAAISLRASPLAFLFSHPARDPAPPAPTEAPRPGGPAGCPRLRTQTYPHTPLQLYCVCVCILPCALSLRCRHRLCALFAPSKEGTGRRKESTSLTDGCRKEHI